jgi:hypothetical protein
MEERRLEEERTGRKVSARRPKLPEEIGLRPGAKVNLTDPESQPLKTHRGWVQGFNGQIMVDCESQVIVSQHVTPSVSGRAWRESVGMKPHPCAASMLPGRLAGPRGSFGGRATLHCLRPSLKGRLSSCSPPPGLLSATFSSEVRHVDPVGTHHVPRLPHWLWSGSIRRLYAGQGQGSQGPPVRARSV